MNNSSDIVQKKSFMHLLISFCFGKLCSWAGSGGSVEVSFSYPAVSDVVKTAIGEYCLPRRSSNFFSFMFTLYNAEASKWFVCFFNFFVDIFYLEISFFFFFVQAADMM